MRNSNRDDRSGSSRDFGSRPDMFDAVCADCGKTCQVPFRPSGDKPVYCSDCFSQKRGGQGRPERRGDRRDDRRDRKMYSAVCDKCGRSCQIPSQPTPGKPVYCDACFGKGGQGGAKGGDQLQAINAKLDKIMNALIAAKIIKPVKEEKPEVKKAPAKAEAKKPSAKTATAKTKAAKEKTPVKKAPVKKKK